MVYDNPDDPAMNIHEVSKDVGVKVKTIHNWIGGSNKKFPRGFKFNSGRRSPRYWRSSVIKGYIAEQENCCA